VAEPDLPGQAQRGPPVYGPPTSPLGARAVDQTESRHLPFRVRRFRIALPVLVRLRCMKPWRRTRRLFFGWYVRLGKKASLPSPGWPANCAQRQTSPHGGPRIIVYGAYIWVKRRNSCLMAFAVGALVYLLVTIVFIDNGAYNDAKLEAAPCHKVAQPQEIARAFRR
jgi:hypothetical protein